MSAGSSSNRASEFPLSRLLFFAARCVCVCGGGGGGGGGGFMLYALNLDNMCL